MRAYVKYILLFIYFFIGVAGWYKYATETQQMSRYDKLSSEMTISYVRSLVWYHSRGKLQELRLIIDNDNLAEEQRIKTRITNMLEHRTSVYIREFNSLNTPIKNLGNWYQDNFDFSNFLKDVFDVVFNKTYTTNEKIYYISDIMEKYQGITTQKLIEVLK